MAPGVPQRGGYHLLRRSPASQVDHHNYRGSSFTTTAGVMSGQSGALGLPYRKLATLSLEEEALWLGVGGLLPQRRFRLDGGDAH